jgi:hypothetical protein
MVLRGTLLKLGLNDAAASIYNVFDKLMVQECREFQTLIGNIFSLS